MSDVGRLRAEARRLHRNATKKISRNNVNRGANIAGSQYDPRRDLSKVDGYNKSQLRSYIAELKQFNARSTQFVPDAQYRPIPATEWKAYKADETALNQYRTDRFNKIADVELPGGRGTLRERREMTRGVHPHMADPSTSMTPNELDRRSKSVASLSALKKLREGIRERMTPEHEKRQRQANRDSIAGMMEIIDEPEMKLAFDEMTDEQFDFYWSSEDMVHDLAIPYELMKTFYQEGKQLRAGQKKMVSDHMSETWDWIEWIKTNI